MAHSGTVALESERHFSHLPQPLGVRLGRAHKPRLNLVLGLNRTLKGLSLISPEALTNVKDRGDDAG